jgi:hypothetical protein
VLFLKTNEGIKFVQFVLISVLICYFCDHQIGFN